MSKNMGGNMIFTDRFVQGIQEDNPWWSSEKIKDIPQFKRSDFKHYIGELKTNQVKILIGPRRVGKTTLIKQIIEYLLNEKKVNPRTILFASLDRTYFELLPQKLDGVLAFFEENVYGQPIANAKETIYIFVDEAQYDSSWSRIMKQYVDQKKPIHAIVSGSSSTELFKDSESGAGRFHTHQLVTMKFRDVVRFKYPKYDSEIRKISYDLRNALFQSITKSDLKLYDKACNKAILMPSKLKSVIRSCLDEYLLKGGYPEFYTNNDWKTISRYYQQDVFDVILQKDVVNAFKIRLPEKIRSLLVVLCQNTSRQLSRKKLCDTLTLKNINTIDAYVDALTEAFLIRYSIKFKQQGYPSSKEKKFYAADTGLRNAFLGVTEQNLTPHERGAIVETAIFNHTLRLGFYVDQKIRRHGHFWVDAESERDIIMDFRESYDLTIPIEVKNGNCGHEDVLRIKKTISKLKSPFGLVVCKDQIGVNGNVLIIPLWLFMISC